jgi:molybdopterin/thiamine biosynthesis adenylyltransferase
MFYARNPIEREVLKDRHVSIVGCGSFGSALADMLVRAGLGRLTLIDPETLAVENLGRHVLTARDVGRPKAEALAARLLEINPQLEVEARREAFRDADGVILSAVDSRRCESLVNAVALAKGLPALYVGAYGAVRAGEVQFYLPGRTPCRECFAQFREPGEEEEQAALAPERYTDPDFDETRVPGRTGLWGSVLAVAGIAFHVALALVGARGKLDAGYPVWIVNLDYDGFRPYAVTRCKLARGCAVCDESKIAALSVEGFGG